MYYWFFGQASPDSALQQPQTVFSLTPLTPISIPTYTLRDTTWQRFRSDKYRLSFSYPDWLAVRDDYPSSSDSSSFVKTLESWSLEQDGRSLVEIKITPATLEDAQATYASLTFTNHERANFPAWKTRFKDKSAIYILEWEDNQRLWLFVKYETFGIEADMGERIIEELVRSIVKL